MAFKETEKMIDFADIESMTTRLQSVPVDKLKETYRLYKHRGDKTTALFLLVANWDRRELFAEKKTARRKLSDVVLSALKPTGLVGPDFVMLAAIFDMIALRKDNREVLTLGYAVNTALRQMGESSHLDM